MEQLQAKHRKEQRDLQSRITQLKKSATKKTRKGVNDQCEALAQELKDRQAREAAEVNGNEPVGASREDKEDDEILNDDSQGDHPPDSSSHQPTAAATDTPVAATPPPQTKKPNRQKARLARRAQEQEAQIAQAEAEAANLPDLREQERTNFQKNFEKHGLFLKEIRPDGHCLYSAVADQLESAGISLQPGPLDSEDVQEKQGYKTVRRIAAEYMKRHPDDFEAFLEEPLADHVQKVADTAEWGGQLELLALARAYGVQINVLQGDGRIEKIEAGEERPDKQATKEIWLGYYRHVYGLGEHYNSLRAKS